MIGAVDSTRNEHYSRGIALYDHGQYAEAVSELDQVLQDVADESVPERRLAAFYIGEAYANLGGMHLSMGMYRNAADELSRALALHPEYADLRFGLGLAYYHLGDLDSAEAGFLSALAINDRFAKALIYLGVVRLRKGNDSGLESIAEAVALEQAYGGTRYDLALSAYESGDRDGACAIFEELAETDTDQVGYLIDKGLMQIRRGDYADAIDTFSEAIVVCPNYADLRHNLGLCYLHQGEVDKAIEEFTRALSINPTFIAAKMHLAQAQAQQTV